MSNDGTNQNDTATTGTETSLSTTAAGVRPTPATLYVFLHGLFVIVDRTRGLELLLPQLPEHSYRAGSFLCESQLQQRPYDKPYYMMGTTPGSARFKAQDYLTVKGPLEPDSKATAEELHAVIRMPHPNAIHGFQSADLKSYIDHVELFDGTKAQLLIVLEYQVPDINQLQLTDHPYLAIAELFGGKSFVSLHLFSEEDFLPSASHPIGGFEAAVNLFPTLKRRAKLTSAPQIPSVSLLEVLPGTIFAEYDDLQTRTQGALANLGHTLRSGFWPSMDSGSDPVGSDVHTCTSLVSCC